MKSRIPVEIVALEPDEDSFMIIGDRRYSGVNASISKETFEAMLQGYVCCLCYERQSQPFPEVCEAPWCHMEIRAKQPGILEELHQGERWIGPRTSNSDDIARMEEEAARRRLEKRGT